MSLLTNYFLTNYLQVLHSSLNSQFDKCNYVPKYYTA